MAAAEEAADPRPIRVIDYLRSPADDPASAWRSAAGDIPRLPLLCSLSQDGTTLIALDGVTALGNGTYRYFLPPPDLIYVDDLKIHKIPLPNRLHGCELTFSSGHFLILQKPPPLPAIHLFSPFSSLAQVATLPPPPLGHTFPASITFNTQGSIALAILCGSSSRRIAYTSLDSESPSTWIDITYQMPRHPHSGEAISFEYPFLYTDGLFHGVDDTGTQVYALDFSTPPQVKFTNMTFDLPISFGPFAQVGVDWCCHQSASLILSGPSLLLVRWSKTFESNSVYREMHVFTLDHRHKNWVRTKSLDNCSFFVGRNLSISMPTVGCPELKPNRVYLCLDADTHLSGSDANFCCYTYYGFRHHLFHDLEDGTWRHFHDDVSLITHRFACPSPFSVWMLPPQVSNRGLPKFSNFV